jgi:hypothetical protein
MPSYQPREIHYRGDLPGPVAAEFYLDRSYFSAIRGPLGSGKTNTAILKLLQLCTEQEPNAARVRPSRILAIRNTYPDLESTTIKDWSAVTRYLGDIRMTHPPMQMMRWELADKTLVEAEVLFLALDREDHVRKLRGTQASFVWLNELKELHKSVLDMATRPLGRYPSLALGGVRCTREAMIGDFNAPDEDHWAAKLELNPQPGWRVFVQPGAVYRDGAEWRVNQQAENLVNLPLDYYDKLKVNKADEWVRVNIANEFGSSVDGKPIHPEFNPRIHVAEFDVDPAAEIVFGQDYGLTPACVLAQDCGGQLRIFDEIVTENFSAQELADAMHARHARDWTTLTWGHGWGDPSGKDPSQADKNTPMRVMRAAGFEIHPAGTNNSFALRRDALGNRLKRLTSVGEPAILIHPRCTIIRKGLGGHYAFKRLRVAGDERYHDVPDKSMFSHVCEGLQYLCVGLGDGRALMGGNMTRAPVQGITTAETARATSGQRVSPAVRAARARRR